ncbi:MAG: glycosyltransferase, partial [Deinococcales bacterium]
STDSTQAVLDSHKSGILRVIQGQELKKGWRGKPNACHQLAKAATGDILAFTDADTIWNPNATQQIVQAMQQNNADALSVWSEQILSTTLGKILQPFMAWSLVGLLPMGLARDSRYPAITSANGQLFAYKKEVYWKFGGFERVKDSILEDIEAAKLLKKEGYRYVLLNGVSSISCKMYDSSKEALDGFAKSNFAAIGYSPFGYIAASALFIWLHWMPFVWLLIAPSPILPFCTITLMYLSRARSDLECKYPLALSLLAPVSVLAWVYVTGVSWYRYAVGKVTWKGRSYDLR